MNSFKNSV